MDTIVKDVSDMTPVEYRACSAANYGVIEGYMLEELRHCRAGRPGKVVMLWDGPPDTPKSLIGWALLTPTRTWGLTAVSRYMASSAKYTVQFWVKAQYRRKGYGKMLMNEVKQLDPRPHVFPHDEASGELFSSFNVRVSKNDMRHIKRGKPKVC